jgi:phytoene synthase
MRAEPLPRSIESDQSYVTRLTRTSGSNFYYSFVFLPKRQRRAMHALYAFCRQVDDSVDGAPDPDEASRRVSFWRDELGACYTGRATHPVTRSLAEHLARFPIRRKDLDDVIDGVAMDIAPGRYRDWEALRVYCYRVASAVGLACIEIFGYTDPMAREYAIRLGLAFQLTNILRDVRGDADRGRIYLPRDDMTRFGCLEQDLRASSASTAFIALMRHEIGRTRDLFAEAKRLLPGADRRSLFAAQIMAAIYEAILDKIDRRVQDVLRERMTLSPSRKIALAAGLFLKSRAPGRA